MFNVHLTILYNNGCDFTINSYMVNVEKKEKRPEVVAISLVKHIFQYGSMRRVISNCNWLKHKYKKERHVPM